MIHTDSSDRHCQEVLSVNIEAFFSADRSFEGNAVPSIKQDHCDIPLESLTDSDTAVQKVRQVSVVKAIT